MSKDLDVERTPHGGARLTIVVSDEEDTSAREALPQADPITEAADAKAPTARASVRERLATFRKRRAAAPEAPIEEPPSEEAAEVAVDVQVGRDEDAPDRPVAAEQNEPIEPAPARPAPSGFTVLGYGTLPGRPGARADEPDETPDEEPATVEVDAVEPIASEPSTMAEPITEAPAPDVAPERSDARKRLFALRRKSSKADRQEPVAAAAASEVEPTVVEPAGAHEPAIEEKAPATHALEATPAVDTPPRKRSLLGRFKRRRARGPKRAKAGKGKRGRKEAGDLLAAPAPTPPLLDEEPLLVAAAVEAPVEPAAAPAKKRRRFSRRKAAAAEEAAADEPESSELDSAPLDDPNEVEEPTPQPKRRKLRGRKGRKAKRRQAERETPATERAPAEPALAQAPAPAPPVLEEEPALVAPAVVTEQAPDPPVDEPVEVAPELVPEAPAAVTVEIADDPAPESAAEPEPSEAPAARQRPSFDDLIAKVEATLAENRTDPPALVIGKRS